MAVPMRIDAARHTVEPGTPVRLFDAHIGEAVPNVVFYRQQHVVTADRQRFFLNRVLDETSTAPITLVLNFKLKQEKAGEPSGPSRPSCLSRLSCLIPCQS